jgi:hypothetical protein
MKICILSTVLASLFFHTTLTPAQQINQAKVTISRAAPARVVNPAQPTHLPNPIATNRVQVSRVQITPRSFGLARPIPLDNGNRYLANYPFPLLDTPANRAKARDDAWAAYRAELQAPTNQRNLETANPISLKNNGREDQLASRNRMNFQYSDSEIRSVQQSLRRLGLYAGLTDGYFGAATQQAIEAYQVTHGMAVTGQPDQALYAQLGIIRRIAR